MELFIGFYILINIFALILMKIDKSRAVKKQWRISEFQLWAAAFFGGALGAWMGMRTFRHKTKRLSFRYGLPFLTFLQALLVLYFL